MLRRLAVDKAAPLSTLRLVNREASISGCNPPYVFGAAVYRRVSPATKLAEHTGAYFAAIGRES